jgi:hypothetical protein
VKTCIWIKQLGSALLLGALITVLGCESVGILRRESIADRGYGDRRDVERRDSDRFDRDSRRDQVYGTVQDVDERRREIRLRTDDGRTTVVRYDSNTRFSDRSRDLRVDSLRSGDWVSVRLERNSGGEQHAESIRLEDRRDSEPR